MLDAAVLISLFIFIARRVCFISDVLILFVVQRAEIHPQTLAWRVCVCVCARCAAYQIMTNQTKMLKTIICTERV